MVSDADGREPSIVRRAAESVTSSAGLDAPTELGALYAHHRVDDGANVAWWRASTRWVTIEDASTTGRDDRALRVVSGVARAIHTQLAYVASGSAGGTRGGTTRVFDDDFVAEPTIRSPVFTKFRRAGYRIRTGDLQLGKLTLYR
jgi:hypothetical protein